MNLTDIHSILNLDYKITEKLTIEAKILLFFDGRDNTREAGIYEAYTNMPWDNQLCLNGSVVNATLSQRR
jgi:hypothetical protein